MKPHVGVAALALMAVTLAACGGGGGGAGSPIGVPPPSSTSALVPLSTSSTTSVQLPEISNGSSGSIVFPIVSAKSDAKVTFQTTLPSGAAQPQVQPGASPTAFAYVTVSLDNPVSIVSTPSFTLSLPSPIAAGSSSYVAMLDMNNTTAGWSVILGPGKVIGTTVSFAPQPAAPPLTLNANDSYVFAVLTSPSIASPPPTIPPNLGASYSGTKSVNFAYGYDFDYPSPAPSVTAPPVTLNYTVTTSVSVGSSPFPGPTPNASIIDEHVAETDTGSLETTSLSTDSWIALASENSGYSQMLYGQTLKEPSSANMPVTTTVYGAPQMLDELPETNGAAWSNNPASTVQYSYASGDAGTRTVSQIGTYTDVEQIGPASGGGTTTMTENGDGSGSIAGPFFGGGVVSSLAFSAPSPAPTGSPSLNVTISFTTPAQMNYGLPAQQIISAPVWYPYTPQTPLSFYNETDTVKANASLPASCSPNPYGATANDVRRKVTELDTLVGDIEMTTFDSYNVDGFPVCLVTNDVLNYAYDEQGNTPYFLYIGNGLGLETVTTNETLVIQNLPKSLASHSIHSEALKQANALVAALQAHQLSSFARDRAVRTHAFIKAMRGGLH